MSSPKFRYNERKRKKEYIPETKYDVDGTIIKNHEAMKNKRWDLKETIYEQKKYLEAISSARSYIREAQSEEQSKFYDIQLDKPWTEETDELFFSRRNLGLASWYIPIGSPIYYEFEGFYNKLKESISKGKTLRSYTKSDRMSLIRQEGESIRHALVLFYDFQKKKQANLKKKIEETKASLPVTPYARAIVETLRKNRVLLVAGDTGCGKSTQVPQILMNAGFDRIACTQPRRIACSSLARRVSYETLNEYGSKIGYQVRFEKNKTSKTRVLFLTEGLLLRQYASDNMLSMYDVIVVDEVHERHMMGDFLLALLKKALAQRNDLYVVLMSATINAELFAQYFDAPTLIIPGKMYSVKIHYWPQGEDDKNLVDEAAYRKRQSDIVKRSIASRSQPIKADPYMKVLDYIDQSVSSDERGDLLIFMPGINEIVSLAEDLTAHTQKSKKWIILMLHSSLTVEEQEKVFDSPPEGVRKCIISSNIAETSITIDGIRFIIDSGKVKEMNHDPSSKVSRLSEFWVSKASAKQRTGRAGRTGPGECFRFYSENEFNHLHDFAIPEIQREALDPLLLQIKYMELGNPRQFDYIEAPSMDSINASMDFLYNLGAVDEEENLLGLGSVLAKLPIDAIVGKMLLLGVVFDVVDPVLTIAAGMSLQSPFSRITQNSSREHLENRGRFDSKHGDPFTLLNLWEKWIETKGSKTSSRKWCKQHMVEEHRLYEISKMKRQFERILTDFQPGLLQTMNQDDKHMPEEETSQPSRNAMRERLRREKYDQRSNKKRRILNTGTLDNDGSSEEGDDIRDLEFSLMNNVSHLKSRASSLSEKEIQMVKLILCSSLYPQLAIGDEHNYYRKSNEIVFHVPAKSFISIHPSSVIASHPEWVQGYDRNVRKDDKTVEESLNYQLLCYLQLLETNKPFLVNITRVPGIHALLLFGKTIDINFDCSVLVIDSYFMIQFRTTQVAEYVLYLIWELRREWQRLQNIRISQGLEQPNRSIFNQPIISPEAKRDLPLTIQQILNEQLESAEDSSWDMWTPKVEKEFQLATKKLKERIVEFLDTSISAELRIAKASELLKMYPKYIAHTTNREQNLPREWKPKEVIRSGLCISANLFYKGIDAPSTASSIPVSEDHIPANIKTFWFCQDCNRVFTFNKMEATYHISRECSGIIKRNKQSNNLQIKPYA